MNWTAQSSEGWTLLSIVRGTDSTVALKDLLERCKLQEFCRAMHETQISNVMCPYGHAHDFRLMVTICCDHQCMYKVANVDPTMVMKCN
jgi:hypothetical protein